MYQETSTKNCYLMNIHEELSGEEFLMGEVHNFPPTLSIYTSEVLLFIAVGFMQSTCMKAGLDSVCWK